MSSPAAAHALKTVTEYLGSAEKQVLRNAATALATIGTPECAVHLAELAVLDQDASVRSRAIAELAGLDESARQAAAEHAVSFLVQPPTTEEAIKEGATPSRLQTRGHANDLLAALARQGTEVTVQTPPLPDHPVLSKKARHFLTPVWTLFWTFGLFWRVRRYLLSQHPPPPLWWPVVLGFLGALPGGTLTAFLFWRWHQEVGEAAFLALCLPPALLTSVLIAVLSRTNVPLEHYCNHRMGALVEALGFLWCPGAGLVRTLAVPLTIAAIGASALGSLHLGFGELELELFLSLLWFIVAWCSLALILAVMRAAAITTPHLGRFGAAVVAGLSGLAIACLIIFVSLRIWRQPGVAILNSETVLLLLPFITAFMSERLLGRAVVARGPSRLLVASLAALSLVVLPGVWLHFNPLQPPRAHHRETPLEQQWWLAQVPVWRPFRVDFEQRVQARIVPKRSGLDLRLVRGGEGVSRAIKLTNGREWTLHPGDYELEVRVSGADTAKKRFRFLVRESYASAVSLIARYLLESSGNKIPPSLVEAFPLELVLNAQPFEAARP